MSAGQPQQHLSTISAVVQQLFTMACTEARLDTPKRYVGRGRLRKRLARIGMRRAKRALKADNADIQPSVQSQHNCLATARHYIVIAMQLRRQLHSVGSAQRR